MDFERSTVQDLINHYRLKPGSIVVEKNGAIIDRKIFKKEQLNDGDVIEIVQFVGGG